MKYNTANSKLIIPEYGRNVQRLIEHAQSIEEDGYRQAFVEKIVDLIIQMHPQTRNVDDYREKVWSHVFMIAKYKLNVVAPCEIINHVDAYTRPSPVPYPTANKRYRHYGKNVHSMIQKACEMEDLEKQQAFANVIGAYMKMAYKTWNRESVSHDIIKNDLYKMSDNKLVLGDDAAMDAFALKKRSSKSSRSSSNNSGSKYSNKGRKNDSFKRRKK